MKKFIMLFLITLSLTGCSLIPRLSFDTEGTTPQATQKSKLKETCKGKVVMNETGDIISCSKGYYNYTENYSKKERKFTFTEKIKNFINKLVGFGFWGLLILVILVPGLFGTFIGRFIEGTVGITGKALKSVVSAVQKTRKTGKDLNESLSAEQDTDVKKYIRKLKENEGIK